MSTQLPTIKLTDFTLAQNGDSRLAFSATGEPILIDPETGLETPLPILPTLTLGVGQGVTVPQRIQSAFAEHNLSFEEADFGLWLTTTNGDAADPAWFGSFTTAGIDLYGVHDLPNDVIQLDGMTFSQLALRVALQVRGTAVTRSLISIAGVVQIDQSIGFVELDGLTASCELSLDVADVAELGAVLSEPASLLDAAFTGKFGFEAIARRLSISNYFAIESADCRFDLAISSPLNDRTLHLGDIDFTLKADSLTLIGAQFDQLDLTCGYRAETERLFMQGSADITLPDLLDSVQSSGATHVQGRFDFEHKPINGDKLTTISVGVDTLTLAPSINLLELSARDIEIEFTYLDKSASDDVWTLALKGIGCQSWSRIATRLVETGAVQLPNVQHLPDLQGTFSISLQDGASSGQLNCRFDFLQPGTGCREGLAPVPFDNTFGPLPVRLANTHLTLSLTFDENQLGDWLVEGEGLLSTTAWLHDQLPIDNLLCSASAQGSGTDLPEIELAISGEMPVLQLPAFIPGTDPIRLFQPQRLAVRLGETLAIDGTALIPSSANLLADLNLPPEWNRIIEPISQVVTGLEANLAVRVPLTESDDPARLSLTLEPINPPEFRLMEALSEVVRAVEGVVEEDADPATQIDSSDKEFFTARPEKIQFELALGGDQELALSLSFSFACSVFGETFDTTAAFRFTEGQPEFLLMAGLTDPIRLVIPGIDAGDVLGQADLSQIVTDYNLDQHLSQIDVSLFPDAQPANALATLQDLENRIQALFNSPDANNSLIFEIRDFGLRVRLDEAPSVSGTVRLVQLPGFLDAVMPENGFDFGLGCSVNRIFISVKGPATRSESGLFEPHETDPLFSIPLGESNGQDQFLHLFFGRFELEYSWTTNAFGFVFDAAVVPAPDSLQGLNLLGNGVYFPGQSTFVKISKPISTGHIPIIIPEWAFSFAREESGSISVTSAADEMGLQVYFGVPDTRLFTVFFKEFTFSPTYYLMQPGLAFDGGVVIGPHQPLDFPDREAFIGALVAGEASDQFLVHYEIEKWVFVLTPSSIGLMLNPLALIPPFLHPMPPFWINPPTYMGDVYFDSISMSVNVPHVLFFGIRTSRPLPTLSIQAMMELAALVMGGFSETIPDHSELRQVMYATLEVNAKLPLIEPLTGPLPALHLFFEVNIVDIVNGMIRMGKAMQQAVDEGIDIVETLVEDPDALIRMIPVEARRFAFPPENQPADTYALQGFSFSGSLYVLTADEFEAELKLFHEELRELPKGLAASQPAQRIAASQYSGPAPLTVAFSLTNLGGEPSNNSVQWNFGDGSTSTKTAVKHTFNKPGQYEVVAVSEDITGKIKTTRHTIVVEGHAVHEKLQLQANTTYSLQFVGNPLTYFSAASDPFQAYFSKQAGDIFHEIRKSRIDPERFEHGRQDLLQKWLEAIWKPFASTAIGDSESRKKLWDATGLLEIFEALEKDIKVVSNGEDPRKPILALDSNQQRSIRQSMDKRVLEVLNRYTLVDKEADLERAKNIVGTIVQLSPGNQRIRRSRSRSVRSSDLYSIVVLPIEKRKEIYKEFLPPGDISREIRGIEACLEPAVRLHEAKKKLEKKEAQKLVEQIIICVSDQLPAASGKVIGSLKELPLFQVDKEAVFDLLAKRAATDAQLVSKAISVNAFNGTVTQGLFLKGLTPPIPADDANIVEEMVGFEVRSRPHESGNTFTVPVTHAAPQYEVKWYAGRYRLILLNGTTVTERHELPDWLTADIPETPQKPAQLRARLFVTERIVTRPRTPAEIAWVNNPEWVDDSYQKSIFARPEYEIKPEGGIHGKMSIGDLLRRTSDGTYIVPAGPSLLTGCVLNVWDIAELKLAGLLAAPNNIFLNGYASVSLTLGRYSLDLQGDFRLIAGDMWEDALVGNSEFEANQLSFNGFAEFKDNGVTKLRGAASGIVGTNEVDLDLEMSVEYHDSWTLEIADTELFKVTMDANLALHLSHDGTQFQFGIGGDMGVKAWIAVPDMVTVELVPAVTACTEVPILPPPLPDGPFFTTECITTPAITAQVPDFSNPDWDEVAAAEVSAELKLAASTSGLSVSLQVAAGGHAETFALPDLINS